MKRVLISIVMVWLPMALSLHIAGAQTISFVEQPIDLSVSGISCIRIFDLDRDGDKDIIGGAERPGSGIYWWRNDGGHPIQWTRFVVDLSIDDAMSVEIAYINNDTFPDIVATELYEGKIDWWENNGDPTKSWVKHLIGESYGAHDAMCADINADGYTDVIGVSSYPGSVSIFYSDGAEFPGWAEHSLCDSLAGAKTVTICDIDWDGDLDVIGAAEIANTVCWWENLGGDPAGWKEHIINSDFAGAQIALPMFMDGDSLYDIIAVGTECQEVAYWLCLDLATNQWIKHTVTDQLGVAVNVRAGDLDRDGDMDLTAVGMIPGELSVFRNDNFSWTPMVLRSEFGRGWALEVDDIDQDGDLDIVAGSEDLGELCLWEDMPDFRPSMTPNSVYIMPGESVSISVSIESQNDYHGTVMLSANLSTEPESGHINFAFNPMYINPSGSCSLTIAASSDITPGQYSATLTVADSVDTLRADSTLSLWILGTGQAAVVGGDHAMMELVGGIWETVDSLWSIPPVIGANYQAVVIEHGATTTDTASIRQYIESGGRVLMTRQTPLDLCGSTDITPISGWVGATGYSNYTGAGIPIVATYDHPFGVTGIGVNDTIGTAVSGFGRLSVLTGNGVRVARLGTLNTVLAGVYCGSGAGYCLYYTGGGGISPQSDSLISGFLTNPALGVQDDRLPGEITRVPETSLKVYPNPSRMGTAVSFALSEPALVRLCVYDITGRAVQCLAEGPLQPGKHTVRWDGKNAKGQRVAAGVYFVRGEWKGKSKTCRLTLVN